MSNSRKIAAISTQSAHKTTAGSQSKVSNSNDGADDVAQEKYATFDSFPRLFLSRCLTGDKQTEVEVLQSTVEKLQAERHDGAASRQAPSSAPREDHAQQSATRRDRPAPASDEESELLREREELLNVVLDQCFQKVLELANHDSIRLLLKQFAELVKEPPEKDPYHAYIELYNTALDELAKIPGIPLHPPAPHALRLSRTDPIPVSAVESLVCRSRFVRTSMSVRNETQETGQDNTASTSRAALNDETLRAVDARGQLATYAMETLLRGPGVVHVINTLVVDECLYIWYHNRQGMICSDGINIIADLPQFLVLLLAFQRFRVENWGIVPCLNMEAPLHPESEKQAESDILKINFSVDADQYSGLADNEECMVIRPQKYLSSRSYCISGRARSVFKTLYNNEPATRRIYSPEVQRLDEGDTLGTIHTVAEKKDPSMLKYLPSLYPSGKGHRTARMIVSEVLEPLAARTGKSFVDAWLDALVCHAFLWKHGIEHGDPSLWNLMYYPVYKCGVLTHFDLSIMAWMPRAPWPDRTGALPFMSLLLLNEGYWKSKVPRFYHHELEEFIWMLPFVFLAYHDGKLDRQNEFIKDWLTSSYDTCREKKASFLLEDRARALLSITPTFIPYKRLMSDALRLVSTQYTMRKGQEMEMDLVLQEVNEISHQEPHLASEAMCNGFIRVPSQSGIEAAKLETHKPIFNVNTPHCQELFREAKVEDELWVQST